VKGGGMESRLVVDGQAVAPSSRWAIRWVDKQSGPAEPVLYRDGKRVTKAWCLDLHIEHAADEFGGNANTD
jgi:hypothetical protein